MYKLAEKVMYFGFDPETAAYLEYRRRRGSLLGIDKDEQEAEQARHGSGWPALGLLVGGVVGGVVGRRIPAKNLLEKAVPVVFGAGIGASAAGKAYDMLHKDQIAEGNAS